MINDGGPAFPTPSGSSVGMSLRDWFAGQALNGMMSTEDGRIPGKGEVVDEWLKRIASQDAEACYRYADAMLLARKGK